MAYATPLMIALLEPMSIFKPSATTGKRVGEACAMGIATVVPANSMPFAPTRIVCPLTIVVSGGSPGEKKCVEDPIMAAEGPSEKVMLPTVTADSVGEGTDEAPAVRGTGSAIVVPWAVICDGSTVMA